MTLRPAFENPYHHPYHKVPKFDPDEIERLCLEGFNLILASRGIIGLWEPGLKEQDQEEIEQGWAYENLVLIHQQRTENQLQGILLKLAIHYRVLEDYLSEHRDFRTFVTKKTDELGGLICNYGELQLKDTLRDCCNKIIHAEDLRAVYGDSSDSPPENTYYIEGTIEVKGHLNGKYWSISFDCFQFFETLVQVAQFVRKSPM